MLSELITHDRVAIVRAGEGDLDKAAVLSLLASLLARGAGVGVGLVLEVILEREALQSTGIGDGVAIPHGALDALRAQTAALVLIPGGVPFDAIDGADVTIAVAVVGPKTASGEHLRTLARISRVLRSPGFRSRLLAAPSSAEAHALLLREEEASAR